MHPWSSKPLEIVGFWELKVDHVFSACVLGRVSPSPSQESLNSSKSDNDAGVCALHMCSVKPNLHCWFIQTH